MENLGNGVFVVKNLSENKFPFPLRVPEGSDGRGRRVNQTNSNF